MIRAVATAVLPPLTLAVAVAACGQGGGQSESGTELQARTGDAGESGTDSTDAGARGTGDVKAQAKGVGGGAPADNVTGRPKQASSVGVSAELFFGEGSLCQDPAVARGDGPAREGEAAGRRYFHVTGNGTAEILEVKSGERIEEVCVFLAGNQTSFSLSLEPGAHVGAVHVIQRGNQSKASVLVDKGGEVGSVRIDQTGNQAFARIELRDSSKDGCALVRLRQRGGASGVKCSR